MNICKECKMGYCPNRVKRVFGYLPAGYCSPQCFTAGRSLADFQKKEVVEKFAAEVLAGQIIDKLFELGIVGDHIAGDPDRFGDTVEDIVPILKRGLEKLKEKS